MRPSMLQSTVFLCLCMKVVLKLSPHVPIHAAVNCVSLSLYEGCSETVSSCAHPCAVLCFMKVVLKLSPHVPMLQSTVFLCLCMKVVLKLSPHVPIHAAVNCVSLSLYEGCSETVSSCAHPCCSQLCFSVFV